MEYHWLSVCKNQDDNYWTAFQGARGGATAGLDPDARHFHCLEMSIRCTDSDQGTEWDSPL